ncbi:small heat shock protein p36-like isoform X2 [Babylonia areolata]|uniref:small heat shock protein p36-like isoform X2 n=1 Tax=Babylonia areolata TaxID=304850 RepID=UPI003FD63091
MYKSEVFIPVQKDSLSFQDRQIHQWSNVEERMEERRKQWQQEFDRMRHDFLSLKPSEKQAALSPGMGTLDVMRSLFDTNSEGHQVFRVRFEVSEFQPEEVKVKVEENKLVVNARHEEKSAQSSISKEYSRQVDIPTGVDQDKLSCTLSKDGVLTVEAPLTTPQPPPFLAPHTTILPVKNALSLSPVSPTSFTSPSSPPSATSSTATTTTINTTTTSSATSPPRVLGVATPVKNAFVTEADGSRRMRLSVDVGDFRPEEIVVKTADRKLIVHAEHEEKAAGRTLHKEFNKEYDLPESVDPSTISAFLSEDRHLTIEAPLKPVVQRKVYEVRQTQDDDDNSD